MYQFARFFSRVAHNGVNYALLLLIVQRTDLAAMNSLLVLALVVPSTVAGIVAGAAADHFPKRILAFAGDAARGGICLLFAGSTDNLAFFYVVAILLSTATQFSGAAQGAMGPLIVKREELTKANAINQAVGGAAQIVGLGILTPIVLRLFDSPTLLFYICAVLFFVAAVQALLVGRIRRPEQLEAGNLAQGGFWTTGWRAMRRDSRVWQAAIELTLISTALTILAGLLPTYIEDVLDLPVDIGALILSPAAAGIAIGLRIASFLSRRVHHAVMSTVGFMIFTVMLFAMAFVESGASFLAGYGAFAWLDDVDIGSFDGGGVVAMMLAFPLGFSYAIVSVAANTVINDLVPLHLQGRVQATQNAFAALVAALPVLVAGLLADLVTVVPVMAAVALGIGAAAGLNLRASHRRNHETVPRARA